MAHEYDRGSEPPPVTHQAGEGRRVLLVSSSFPRWSADSTTPFILHLAQDLRLLDWDVHILAPHAPGASTAEWLGGVPVERFRYLWPESLETVCYEGGALINLRRNRWNVAKVPFLVVAEWAALVRRLLRTKIDLVHSHWILPQGLTSGLSARPLGVPHVASVHGSDVFALRGPMLRACKRLALGLADAVTVNSSATRTAVVQLLADSDRIIRIPLGASATGPADADAVQRLRNKYRRGRGPLLIFVGRLVDQKGVGDLLEAVGLLRHEQPDVTALIAGEGQDREALQRMALDLGIAERVTFLGWVQPELVPHYLTSADMFVGPSKSVCDGSTEGQGLTFIEAMLAGTPVIATRIGGITDAVQHEQTGLLVSERAPKEIASAVARLVAEPELAVRLRDNGLALARREFTREASARAFSALFDRVLSEHRHGGATAGDRTTRRARARR